MNNERTNTKAQARRIERACERIRHLPNITLKARIIRNELTPDEVFAARFLLHLRAFQQQERDMGR
jgi:hypothetical protein